MALLKGVSMVTIPKLFRNVALVAAGTLLCVTADLAASAGAVADAQTRYRQDMAACNSGQSNQDVATCHLEARNALAESRRGGLNDTPGQYRQNALRRCAVQKGDDRADCEARIRGEGNAEGSVSGGGVLHKSETVVPGN
jgi:hypothetical protein